MTAIHTGTTALPAAYCFIARRGNKPPLLSGVPIMPPLRRLVYNFCQNLRFFAIEGIIAICQVENKMDFVKSVASFDVNTMNIERKRHASIKEACLSSLRNYQFRPYCSVFCLNRVSLRRASLVDLSTSRMIRMSYGVQSERSSCAS